MDWVFAFLKSALVCFFIVFVTFLYVMTIYTCTCKVVIYSVLYGFVDYFAMNISVSMHVILNKFCIYMYKKTLWFICNVCTICDYLSLHRTKTFHFRFLRLFFYLMAILNRVILVYQMLSNFWWRFQNTGVCMFTVVLFKICGGQFSSIASLFEVHWDTYVILWINLYD